MPNVIANIPWQLPPLIFGSAGVAFQDSEAMGIVSRVECAIFAGNFPGLPPGLGGNAASITSIGFNAGTPSPGSTGLHVIASGTIFENALVIAGFSSGGSQALLRLYVEEFTAAGGFVRALTGTPSIIYNDNETFLGINARQNQLGNFLLNATFPVVAGRQYRVWVDSLQNVYATPGFTPEAVSNFAYNVGPIAFTI